MKKVEHGDSPFIKPAKKGKKALAAKNQGIISSQGTIPDEPGKGWQTNAGDPQADQAGTG